MIYLAPAAEAPAARFLANAGCVLLTHHPDAETLALALRLLHRAAEAHDALAESVLGWCHLFGEHLPHDEALAVRYLRASAARDFPDGLFWYGLCLCEGRGTARDLTAGRALIERAAAAGHYEAAEWLSECAPQAD